jgi:uncharacterized protein (TIGR00375 family)
MRFTADLHLHSKYSRATSPQMELTTLDRWAGIKGVQVLGTGDFTHPYWMENIKKKLEPAEEGFFKIKGRSGGFTRFVLTAEISCIYSKGDRVRKVHIVVLAPSIEAAEEINRELSKRGNLSADGRPILGLDVKELTKIILDVSERCMIIPAHVMTPWFALFGSKSGFDSLEECFEEYSDSIFAMETGLSADPAMIWRLEEGARLALVSNSDAHSPANIGREANVFDTAMDYRSLVAAIKDNDRERFLYTVEFFPQEGKYHYDGHRACGVCFSPAESEKCNNVCPNCGRPLTIGVLNRIEKLAREPEGFRPPHAPPFKSLVPLREIIGEALGVGSKTKKVKGYYEALTGKLGGELGILLQVPREELELASVPEIAEGIIRVREGRVIVEPGYDGVYGKVKIFSSEENRNLSKQGILL